MNTKLLFSSALHAVRKIHSRHLVFAGSVVLAVCVSTAAFFWFITAESRSFGHFWTDVLDVPAGSLHFSGQIALQSLDNEWIEYPFSGSVAWMASGASVYPAQLDGHFSGFLPLDQTDAAFALPQFASLRFQIVDDVLYFAPESIPQSASSSGTALAHQFLQQNWFFVRSSVWHPLWDSLVSPLFDGYKKVSVLIPYVFEHTSTGWALDTKNVVEWVTQKKVSSFSEFQALSRWRDLILSQNILCTLDSPHTLVCSQRWETNDAYFPQFRFFFTLSYEQHEFAPLAPPAGGEWWQAIDWVLFLSQ